MVLSFPPSTHGGSNAGTRTGSRALVRSPKSVSSTVEWTNFILPTFVDRILVKQLTSRRSPETYVSRCYWHLEKVLDHTACISYGKLVCFSSSHSSALSSFRSSLLFVCLGNLRIARAIRACATLARGSTVVPRATRLAGGDALWPRWRKRKKWLWKHMILGLGKTD